MPVLVSEIIKTTNGQITNRGIYNVVYYLLTVYKNFGDDFLNREGKGIQAISSV